VDIGKTPTDTHKFLKQSEKHSKVSRLLIFKWHKRFADGRDSLGDDERKGRPSFRESDAVKNEVQEWNQLSSVVIIRSRILMPPRLTFLINCFDNSTLFVKLLTHAVPRGQTVNSEYYSKVINIIITFEINELIIFPVNLN
jgi:hypothetical protein